MARDKTEYTGELEVEKYEASAPVKKYLVMSKENRTIEFRVGRTWLIFAPYEQKEISEAIRNHPDFLQQEIFFAVKEL